MSDHDAVEPVITMAWRAHLTLLIGSVARGLDLQPRQEIDEPTEVVIAKMGSARADLHPRIVGHDIGPLERKPGELS